MDLVQMQVLVTDIIGNLSSSDRFYKYVYPAVGAESTSVINIACNKVVRLALGPNLRNFDLFPELRNTWTIGPTISGANIIARPSDCIVVSEVSSAQSSTSPGTWAATRENPVNFKDPELFGVISKDSTITGYATIWSRKGKSILINPTPSAAYIDYLRFYGIAKIPLLINPTDIPYIHEDYHDAVVKMAAGLLARIKGWRDVAADMIGDVERELATQHNMVAEERARLSQDVEFDMITRGAVYGSGGGGGGW